MNTNETPVGVVATDTSKVAVYGSDGTYYGTKQDTKMVMLFKDLPLNTPVYSKPVEFVGLTDEEVETAWDDEIMKQDGTYVEFARAIEAKLREKNQL